MQFMNNRHCSPVTEVYFEGHSMCSLIEHFPVTLYAHTALSQRAKICPLLKSLGSKLVRLSYIVIWIWMCFLACSPCSHRVGKGTLCCGLPCDFWGFWDILKNHMISRHIPCSANTGAPSKSAHLLSQDARFAKVQVHGVSQQRTGALSCQLSWRSGVRHSFSELLLWPLSKTQRRCAGWADEPFVLQISSKRCRVNSTVPN